MIKAMIIDDEPDCITALQHDIELFCPDVKVMATCRSGHEGILAISSLKPQLVFLDISMPVMTGFEMLEQLKGSDERFDVVFTTAFDQHVLKALRTNALDYLLKPIDPEQLISAIERLQERERIPDASERVENLAVNANLPPLDQRVALSNKSGYDFVKVRDILYCRADRAYSEIIFVSGRKLLVSKPLSEIEASLPESLFFRIHNSTLVNVIEITGVRKGEGLQIVMSNNETLGVSRAKKENLMKRLGL